ncbi:nitrate- and nitrite sensing domain-containing protein [Micromonospora sp. WMMD1102]|uniref:sensor histidine kinase n=1 Tax=Micromonospora sp. WMMD1102 TaxID=3016105 RepID=UPI00241575C1|nr:nitrate- and nitrite sensing domain-containing protein [Micromonospora sp. WMMD1102]MDG4791474.1 nitrate- and nitrite sensing domain-containing protein [Micromonospora sp. WMMD1102]
MLGRLRIRGRLALLVILPLLSTLGLAVPVLADRIDSARRAADTADTVRRAGQVGTLVQDLQRERLLSVGYLLNMVDRSQLVQQTAQVGDRIADLRADLGGQSTPEIENAIAGVRRLSDVRAGVLARRARADQVINAFGQVDEALIESLGLTRAAEASTPEGRQMIALDAVLRTDDGISAAACLIMIVAATKNPAVGMAYVGTMARLESHLARFRSFATPAQNEVYRLIERATTARTGPDFFRTGATDPTGAIATLDLANLFPAATSLITLGQFIEKKIVTDVIAEVTDQRQRAIAGAYLVSLLVLLIIALMMLLSLAVARTVARPLTRLTVSAERMARAAEEELTRIVDEESESYQPIRLDPVDVDGRDEVGDLARAFERVQGTAARLVERQAASRRNVAQMFGHVGRRTQNLVGRQIALIDRLEHQETDPGRLQHLYRLDHVSSRLRRNASSLVVLSGGAGGDGHVAPLPLGDVVRLALGEIEDFTRVDVQVRLDVAVAPGVIGDLVLTLAELMENATAFSPPHTRVTVLAEVVPGGVRLNLVDHGIGMTPERLAEENARLTRRERLDLVPTEVLGLFVVGRLARRHGWRVTLSATTPGGGVTVGVEIDDRLLVNGRPDAELPTPRASASAPLPVRPVRPSDAGTPLGRATVPTAEPAPARPLEPVSAGPAGPTPTRSAGPTPTRFAEELTPGRFADESAPTRFTEPAPPRFAEPTPARFTEPVRTGPAQAAPVAEEPLPVEPTPVFRLPELMPVAVPAGPVFDEELIRRATRSLTSGQPWNAFLTRPGASATEVEPAGTPAGGTPVGRPNGDVGGGPASSGAPATPSADSGPGSATSGPGTGLRQRVPGAQLPDTTSRSRPEPTPADPSVVRALIEEFEAGVRRAQREQQVRPARPDVPPAGSQPRPEPAGTGPAQPRHGGTEPAPTGPDPSDPPPGGTPAERHGPHQEGGTLGPAGSTSRPNGSGTPPAATGAPPRLNRRVPGANLSVPPPTTPLGQAPAAATAGPDDPDKVRELMTQFESGVARALSEVRTEHRHEEGTPR